MFVQSRWQPVLATVAVDDDRVTQHAQRPVGGVHRHDHAAGGGQGGVQRLGETEDGPDRKAQRAQPGGGLVKVALTPSQVPEFVRAISGEMRGWIGSGGNVGYLSLPAGQALPTLAWPAVTLRGEPALWPGVRPRFEAMRAMKSALDPQNRFPNLDD